MSSAEHSKAVVLIHCLLLPPLLCVCAWHRGNYKAICMRKSRVGTGCPTSLLENHENIGFLSNTGPDPLKNHKATKLAFNVGLSPARQRNAI